MMLDIKRWLLIFLCAAPLRAQSPVEQGIADYNAGRYSEAITVLHKAGGHDNRALTFLALAQAAVNDCASALPVLTKPAPELDRVAKLAAANCYASSGQTASALLILENLAQRNPNDADVLYLTAKINMKAFNDATFLMFQKTPASYRVHQLSAEIFEVQSRFTDAITEYKKTLALNPKATSVHYHLGRDLLLQSHSPEAMQEASTEFKAELQVSPEDSACEFQLGQIAQIEQNSSEAKAHFERAIQLSPNFTHALVALGKIDSQQKDYPSAIANFSRAIQLEPENETAHYALMTAYRDSGQRDKARQEKATLDRLQKPPEGEFTDFLKKLGDKTPAQ